MKNKQHAIQVKADPDWDPKAAPTFWINHASRLIMRRFEQELRPLGFGMAYLPVTIALEENGSLQQKDLVERARVEQATMAALLGRMERDGLISRTPDPDDGRASKISLTSKAKTRLPRVKDGLRVGVARAMTGFSEGEKETLLRLLKRVVTNLQDPEEG